MTYGSCQSRCESNVQTYSNPYCSASLARCTVREAGGLVCSTAPNSMWCCFLGIGDRACRDLDGCRACRDTITAGLDQVLRESALHESAITLGAEILVAVDHDLAA